MHYPLTDTFPGVEAAIAAVVEANGMLLKSVKWSYRKSDNAYVFRAKTIKQTDTGAGTVISKTEILRMLMNVKNHNVIQCIINNHSLRVETGISADSQHKITGFVFTLLA